MKISGKLFLGFAAVLLLSVAVGVMGIVGMNLLNQSAQSLHDEQVVGMENLVRAVDYMNQSTTNLMNVTFMSLHNDLLGAQRASDAFERSAALFLEYLSASITIDELGVLYRPLADEFNRHYLPDSRHIISLAIANIPDQARRLDVNVLMAGNMETIGHLRGFLDALAEAHSTIVEHTVQRNQQQMNFFLALQIGSLLLTILLGVGMAVLITRSIARPVTRLGQLVKDVSAGNLQVSIDRSRLSKDEVGAMTADVYRLVEIIKGLAGDLTNIYTEHIDKGNYAFALDESRYSGVYRDIAGSLNKAVISYASDMVELINVAKSYSEGDFAANVSPYPESWKWANEAVNGLRANFIGITREINALAKSTANGKLDVRVDTSKYGGDWRDIMDGLNRVTEAVNAPIREMLDVLVRLGEEGYLDKRIEGDYSGAFLAIKNAVNSTMNNLTDVIRDVSRALSAMSSGDLTAQISADYPGDFTTIKESINTISTTLHKTVSEISAASDQVLSGANQISKSATELAGGAQEQASSVQELNASIEMINRQTTQNANNALEASNLSQKSTENAHQGNETMKQMLSAMEQIKESSGEISKIIKNIEDITFQTNLLSLNASVEAARAGEHGRGFAVVADEVRNLANKSQQSTVETTDLINDSITRVDAGSAIAQSTSESLAVIVRNAAEIMEIISHISTSSKEQAEAVGHVNTGLSQISAVVQSNSAVSEQAAAAAQELTSQAELLRQLVAYFKL